MWSLAPLITFAINALRVMLFVQAGKIIVGILGFFGLTYATNKYAVAPLLSAIQSMVNTGPTGEFGSAVMEWMGLMRFDQALTMLISAWTIAFAIKSAKTFLKVTS